MRNRCIYIYMYIYIYIYIDIYIYIKVKEVAILLLKVEGVTIMPSPTKEDDGHPHRRGGFACIQ